MLFFLRKKHLHRIIFLSVFLLHRQLRRFLTEDVIKDLMGDAHAIAELEKEWEQLQEDRNLLRQTFPMGNAKARHLFNFF